jgi:hypothetical protein
MASSPDFTPHKNAVKQHRTGRDGVAATDVSADHAEVRRLAEEITPERVEAAAAALNAKIAEYRGSTAAPKPPYSDE